MNKKGEIVAFDHDETYDKTEQRSQKMTNTYINGEMSSDTINASEYGLDCEQEGPSEDVFNRSRVQLLEEEQESLLSSLQALTTHFAQVQLRLHQIVEAPEKERDIMLKKLEDFADRGVPNWSERSSERESKNILTSVDRQKSHQYELIEHLKTQLDDLEKYAYESGEPILPQAVMIEKQKIIIDELKQKINLNFNELDLPQLSPDELRNQVDSAFGQFLNPIKIQFELITQLKTQVKDLEQFIKFLQIDQSDRSKLLKIQFLKKQKCSEKDLHRLSCSCNYNELAAANSSVVEPSNSSNEIPRVETSRAVPNISDKFHQMLNKASTIFQIFAISQMGCSSQNGGRFRQNTLKKTMSEPHWGDIRARLEVDIQEILTLVIQIEKTKENEEFLMMMREKEVETEDDEVFVAAKIKVKAKQGHYRELYSSTSSSISVPNNSLISSSRSDELKSLNIELITLVRKKFAVNLQKLIQHGLRNVRDSKSLVPLIGCFANFQLTDGRIEDHTEMHAWELIIGYYNIKNGDVYTETAAQKLSQSFNLEIVSESSVSNKKTLLLAIRDIINLHSPYKRSLNSHFKAFVCAGLNSHKLMHWLNQILQCHELVTKYYASWSYVATTGFRDALKSIDQLSKHEFYDLPVDLAIRNLANIKDVFS